MRYLLLNLIMLFSCFLCIHPQELSPILLRQGLALYLADYFPQTFLEKIKNSLKTLPSLRELEDNIAIKENNLTHDQFIDAFIAEFIAPYLFVEFIDTQWNRETLLNLLNNYVDFENILNFRKKDVEKHWHYCSLFKTYGFKSGDEGISCIMDDIFYTFEQALNASQKDDQSLSNELIMHSFEKYRKNLEKSDNHILMVIKTNQIIAGWALFSLQSEQHAMLEVMCIHPEYKKYDLGRKLVNGIPQKFNTVKSIITMNKDITIKSSYFCGNLEIN